MTTTVSGTTHGSVGFANRANTSAIGNPIQPATLRRRIAVGKLGAFNVRSTPGPAIKETVPRRLRRQASRIRMAVAVVPPMPIASVYVAYATSSNPVGAEFDGAAHVDLAWSYPAPRRESESITGLVCFYDELVDLTVDDTLQPRPRTHFVKARGRRQPST